MSPERAAALNAALSTPSLLLEPVLAAHADLLFLSLLDESLYTYVPEPPPRSLPSLRSWWAQLEGRLSPDGTEAWLAWAMRLRQGGRYVGKIDAAVDGQGVCNNVGYVVFPAYAGRGYASESLAAVSEHLLARGVRELRARVVAEHTASIRVLARCGYAFSGLQPDSDWIDGSEHETHRYIRR